MPFKSDLNGIFIYAKLTLSLCKKKPPPYNPSIMNIIPIFRYEDLGYNADMGSGVVSCFDVGTGTNKSEIFIGAFQASLVGSRAVSLPRTDQTTSINFDTAKTYCANKVAGWHLMTMHEWAAPASWQLLEQRQLCRPRRALLHRFARP